MNEEVIEEVVQTVIEPKISISEISREAYLAVCLPTHSENIGELAKALAAAQGDMSNGAKDKQGYGYKYMTLATVTDLARAALSKNDIAVIQTHFFIRDGEKSSVVTFTELLHSSGQWHKSSLELPVVVTKGLSPSQAIGVGCTYGRRYSLQAVCMIAAEDDNDASPRI